MMKTRNYPTLRLVLIEYDLNWRDHGDIERMHRPFEIDVEIHSINFNTRMAKVRYQWLLPDYDGKARKAPRSQKVPLDVLLQQCDIHILRDRAPQTLEIAKD